MAGCMVFFRSGTCDLDVAACACSEYGLTVVRQGEQLVVSRPGSPLFLVKLAVDEWVRKEAAEIGQNTPYAAVMRESDARFEIEFDDLEEALQEFNTLMELQGALQDACEGTLFLPWNGNLSGPWQE